MTFRSLWVAKSVVPGYVVGLDPVQDIALARLIDDAAGRVFSLSPIAPEVGVTGQCARLPPDPAVRRLLRGGQRGEPALRGRRRLPHRRHPFGETDPPRMRSSGSVPARSRPTCSIPRSWTPRAWVIARWTWTWEFRSQRETAFGRDGQTCTRPPR